MLVHAATYRLAFDEIALPGLHLFEVYYYYCIMIVGKREISDLSDFYFLHKPQIFHTSMWMVDGGCQ
jgi:hypothetical protein